MKEKIHFMTNDRLIKITGLTTILVAIVLISLKTYIWVVTQSLSIKASLFDSLLDGLTSTINFYAVIQAAKPADSCHPFGHGKIEALTSFAQSIFISGSVLWLLGSIISHCLHPTPLIDTGGGILGMSVVTLITGGLVLFQQYAARKTNSLLIKTDKLHYETDFLVNLGVLGSLVLSFYFQLVYLDLIIGLLIVIYILIATMKIFKTSINILLDHELSPEDRNKILDIIHQSSQVNHLVKLRTRSCGRHQFIEATLQFKYNLTAQNIHIESERITMALQKEFHDADVVIQVYHPS